MEEKNEENRDALPQPGGTPYVQSTAHEHYYALEDPVTAVCALGCGHGCLIDPETEEVRDGRIVGRNV